MEISRLGSITQEGVMMTEQEYCDLTDLQLARQMKNILRDMNCFDEPLLGARNKLAEQLSIITQHLEPIINENMD